MYGDDYEYEPPRSPGKNNPPYYPDDYTSYESEGFIMGNRSEDEYENMQNPANWQQRVNLDRCVIGDPDCMGEVMNQCLGRTAGLYSDYRHGRMPVPSINDLGNHPQDKAMRHLVRNVTDWHRRRKELAWYPRIVKHAGGTRNPYGWDTRKWYGMNFNRCWPEHPSCSNSVRRAECAAKTKEIYDDILTDPGNKLRRYHGYEYLPPQDQAVRATTREMQIWHEDYNNPVPWNPFEFNNFDEAMIANTVPTFQDQETLPIEAPGTSAAAAANISARSLRKTVGGRERRVDYRESTLARNARKRKRDDEEDLDQTIRPPYFPQPPSGYNRGPPPSPGRGGGAGGGHGLGVC